MDRRKFLAAILLTLVFFNISRVVGWEFFAETGLWTRIVNDDFHHWQLGLVLIIASLILKKLTKQWYLLLAVSIGMIIDESMYLFSPLYWRFNHYSWEGVVFEFLTFAAFSLITIRLTRQRTDGPE